jgi:formate hydrogenlyase subunit 3/multisubunit Na+/H+ antiporter MnhD subunit
MGVIFLLVILLITVAGVIYTISDMRKNKKK